jgi:hypothetical protein
MDGLDRGWGVPIMVLSHNFPFKFKSWLKQDEIIILITLRKRSKGNVGVVGAMNWAHLPPLYGSNTYFGTKITNAFLIHHNTTLQQQSVNLRFYTPNHGPYAHGCG